MKKFTKEQIQEVVTDMMKDMAKNTLEILLDNMENCTSQTCELEDKKLVQYIDNVMIPVSTAYQMSMFAMTNALCKLLCEDELEGVKNNVFK